MKKSEFRSIAVVIPCLNEVEYIKVCLDALITAADRVGEVIIFVVDGMSTDGTREVVKEISEFHPIVQLLDNPHRSTPHALNIGLKTALTDVKIILGAHSAVHADFLSANLNVLAENPDFDCVGGILDNVYADPRSMAIGRAMASPFGVGNAHFRTGGRSGEVDTVAFGAYRKEVFGRIGFFDEELFRNQDDEFNYRLTSSGGRIYLDPRIKCRYYVRADFGRLAKQYEQYGYFKVLVNRKHKSVTTIRQLVPALFVVYILSLPLIYLLASTMWRALASIPLIAYVVMSMMQAAINSKGDPWVMMRAFFTLHWNYGWGYLKGVVHFLIFGREGKEASTSR